MTPRLILRALEWSRGAACPRFSSDGQLLDDALLARFAMWSEKIVERAAVAWMILADRDMDHDFGKLHAGWLCLKGLICLVTGRVTECDVDGCIIGHVSLLGPEYMVVYVPPGIGNWNIELARDWEETPW